MLMEQNPERFNFFLTGNAETKKNLTEYTRRQRLHRIAEVIVTLDNAGVVLFPDEKPILFSETPLAIVKPLKATFYFSREMKNLGLEHLKIRSSRAAGVIFADSEILLTYNTGNNLMKWEYQTELRCKALMTSRFCQNAETAIYNAANISGLILGTGMDVALPLLVSKGGYHKRYFCLDGTFEHFYYAPNTSEGELQVRILCAKGVRSSLRDLLVSGLAPKRPGLRVEHDAVSAEGAPVLLAFDLH